MKEEIEIARLIALAKKAFPPVDSDFYEKLRKKIRELDIAIETAEKEGDEEKKLEMQKERENIKNYAYKIYDRRMRSLMVQLSKKISGGKSDLSQFTEEEKALFQELYDIVEERRREFMEGKIDIIHEGKFEISESTPEEKPVKTEERAETKEMKTKDEKRGKTETAEETGDRERPETGEKKGEKDEKRKEMMIPVRMLSDEAFVGLDGHYYYPKKGDILNLPEKIASILLKGRYAERIGI